MTVTIDPSHPMYLEQADVRNEMSRVFDICNGCRQCVGLCTSFPTLFEFIGRHADHDAGRMTPFEQDQVVDQCFQCTLCSLDCPYVGEPDDASVDFPRLMLRAKAMQHAEGVASTRGAARTHMVNHTDRLGKLATSTTPIIGPIIGSSANRILNRIARSPSGSSLRKLTARATGVSAVRLLPPYAKQRFSTWFAQRPSTAIPGPPARVTVYPTCVVEYQEPDIGKDLVKVYEHNGIGCTVSDAGCCGAPWLHSGDVEQFRKVAEKNVRVLAAEIRAGTDIVVAQPTCSQLVKQEYVTYVEGPDAELVAAHTYDACEYLMRMHAGDPSSLDVEFPGDRPGSITCHAPCHLRAQRIGPASRDLLALTGAEVTVVEQCSGTDGMWGLRAGNEDISIPIARQLGDRIDQADVAVVAGDCHLANTAIVEQTGRTAKHPLQILARAYGLAED